MSDPSCVEPLTFDPDVLRLALVPGIGPKLGRALLNHFGSGRAIWQAVESARPPSNTKIARILETLKRNPTDLDRLMEECLKHGIQVVTIGCNTYPPMLRELDDAPLAMFIKGDPRILSSPRILAVVGTRKDTQEGRLIARRWCASFAAHGIAIVSGMAYGIDQAAHLGAIDGGGPTIAVLACGILRQPPSTIMQKILEQGCVISEHPPYHPAKREFFPRRNRIIAGLAHATLVVEAALRSGALITARLALDYGREVLAVPGSVMGDAHVGCHQLLRDGALLADSTSAVLAALGWQESRPSEEPKSKSTKPSHPNEEAVIALLEQGVMYVDRLAEELGLTISELSPILIGLELQGVIESLPGARYHLIKDRFTPK